MVLGCAVGASRAGGSAAARGAPGGDPRRDGGRGYRGHRHPRAAAPPLADPRGGCSAWRATSDITAKDGEESEDGDSTLLASRVQRRVARPALRALDGDVRQ